MSKENNYQNSFIESICVGGDSQGYSGDSKIIFITAINVNDIDLIKLDLFYDSNILNIINVNEGNSNIRFGFKNITPGKLALAIASPGGPLSGTFKMAKIDIHIIGPENSCCILNMIVKAFKIKITLGIPTGANEIPISNVQSSTFVILPSKEEIIISIK